MKPIKFLYFSGEDAYFLLYLAYYLELDPSPIFRLFKNLEIIIASEFRVYAMRFDPANNLALDMKKIENNWILTELGECLDVLNLKKMLLFCKKSRTMRATCFYNSSTRFRK